MNECDRNDDARKRQEMRCVYDAIEKGKVVDAGLERWIVYDKKSMEHCRRRTSETYKYIPKNMINVHVNV